MNKKNLQYTSFILLIYEIKYFRSTEDRIPDFAPGGKYERDGFVGNSGLGYWGLGFGTVGVVVVGVWWMALWI